MKLSLIVCIFLERNEIWLANWTVEVSGYASQLADFKVVGDTLQSLGNTLAASQLPLLTDKIMNKLMKMPRGVFTDRIACQLKCMVSVVECQQLA